MLGTLATSIAAIFMEVADRIILFAAFKADVLADGVPLLVLIPCPQKILVLIFPLCI